MTDPTPPKRRSRRNGKPVKDAPKPRVAGKALIPPSLLPPFPGRRGIHKRTRAQAATELARLCQYGLLGYRPGEIHRRNNEERRKMAAGIAAERGLSPAETEAFVAQVELTEGSTLTPYRKLLASVDEGNKDVGRLLILGRIEELQASCRHLDLIELGAVEAFEASKAPSVTTVESAEEGDMPATPRRREERRVHNRVASDKLLETARRCVHDRDRLQGEVFRLAIKLGLVETTPEELQSFETATAEQLMVIVQRSLSVLYGAEASIAGEPLAAERRVELMMKFLQQKLQNKGGGTRELIMAFRDYTPPS